MKHAYIEFSRHAKVYMRMKLVKEIMCNLEYIILIAADIDEIDLLYVHSQTSMY